VNGAGIRDVDIGVTELRADFVGQPTVMVNIGYVALYSDDTTPEFRNCNIESVLTAAGDDHLGTMLREQPSRRLADPAVAAGNNRNFSI
jgi:hypothetical protein